MNIVGALLVGFFVFSILMLLSEREMFSETFQEAGRHHEH